MSRATFTVWAESGTVAALPAETVIRIARVSPPAAKPGPHAATGL